MKFIQILGGVKKLERIDYVENDVSLFHMLGIIKLWIKSLVFGMKDCLSLPGL